MGKYFSKTVCFSGVYCKVGNKHPTKWIYFWKGIPWTKHGYFFVKKKHWHTRSNWHLGILDFPRLRDQIFLERTGEKYPKMLFVWREEKKFPNFIRNDGTVFTSPDWFFNKLLNSPSSSLHAQARCKSARKQFCHVYMCVYVSLLWKQQYESSVVCYPEVSNPIPNQHTKKLWLSTISPRYIWPRHMLI